MAALTPTTSGIVAEHEEIVTAIEMLYQTLIDLNYVSNTDVQVPPHGLPKDPIAVAPLRAAGLDPKTIELIGRLPCFTNDLKEAQRKTAASRDGISVAPFSSAASYLLGSGRHDEAREVGVGGPVGGDELLPPSAFKLATSSNDEGYNLAYDLNDKTILQWRPDHWSKCQRIPVTTFFDMWLQNIKTLEWLPWRDDFGWEMEAKQVNREKDLADPNSPVTQQIKAALQREKDAAETRGAHLKPIEDMFAQYLLVHKAAHNRYWARRRIYEECGWPGRFDQEAFEQRQNEWNAKAKALGASASSKARETYDGDSNSELYLFYKTSAGEYAV